MAGGYVKKKKEPYDQKTAVLKPEEQAMREENLIAREHMCPDGMAQLSAAICLRAICDYRNIRKKLLMMEQIDKYPEEVKTLRTKLIWNRMRMEDYVLLDRIMGGLLEDGIFLVSTKYDIPGKTAQNLIKMSPKDFKNKLEDLRKEREECEEFFDSEIFARCTGYDNRHDAIQKIMTLTPNMLETIEGGLKRA